MSDNAGDLFHELGYSLIRPQSFPSKGYKDTEVRKASKKAELAKSDDCVLVYQDEVHFQQQTMM